MTRRYTICQANGQPLEARASLPEAPAEDPASLYAFHGQPGRFFNPWRPFDTGLADLLRWKRAPNPYGPRRPPRVPVVANDGAYLRSRQEPPSVTWVGHSTFAIHDPGEGHEVALTDP